MEVVGSCQEGQSLGPQGLREMMTVGHKGARFSQAEKVPELIILVLDRIASTNVAILSHSSIPTPMPTPTHTHLCQAMPSKLAGSVLHVRLLGKVSHL